MKQRNPWTWIPTLYIAEGLPNVVVMTVAVVMYMQLGLSDTDIALYTGWLGLPWVIKPLWSPFVDLYRTKRWWVLSMQLLLGSSLAGVAFTLNAPFWFQGSMAFFFLMAFASATHDIAADGYYMLELDDHQQVYSEYVLSLGSHLRQRRVDTCCRHAATRIPQSESFYVESCILRNGSAVHRHLALSCLHHATFGC